MKKLFINSLLAAIILLSATKVLAQSSVSIKSIPYPLEIVNDPVSFKADETTFQLSAKGKTNLFNSPSGTSRVQNAPMALFQPEGDFTLSAKVSAELKSVYDVAALVVYQDEDTWAKFCYENAVDKVPTIVSVVTRTYSDDSNSIPTGSFAYMSIVRKGEEMSFFYSTDRVNWKLIRHFRLQLTGKLKAGFAVHGSRGDGLTGQFSEIQYWDKAFQNMRNDN